MRNQLNLLLAPKTNAPAITFLLTTILDVKLTESTIKADLEQHPDFPSLLSISDILSTYNISNLSLKIDAEQLFEVPVPFITQLKGQKNELDYFTVIKQVRQDTIIYADPKSQKWITESTDGFLKRWTGVVLMAEAGDASGEADYTVNAKKEKWQRAINNIMAGWLPVMVLLAGLAALMNAGLSALLPFLFTVFTLTGACAGFLLMWYQHDRYNPVLTQFCGGGDQKVNCNAILSSKASKIAGISWSVIGFSYFTGGLLLQLFWGILNPQTLFVSGLLSILAAPYVIYSVYYQWRIARHWCSLCLFVQGLLLLQLGTGLAGQWHTLFSFSNLNLDMMVQIIVAFSLPLMLAHIIFGSLRKVKEKQNAHIELQRFKHDPGIFRALLEKQQKVDHSPAGLGIQLGDAGAPYKIIKVCNPYCDPCAKAHTPIDELLHSNPLVQLQIIFTATDDEADYRSEPVKHLMAIHEKHDEQVAKKALNDWYLPEEKNYNKFAGLYKMNGELKQQGQKLAAMAGWCRQTEISLTPTFFISLPQDDDGSSRYYKLPEIYNITDLKYLLSV
jgi:uncharacterized membrane protein